MASAFAVAVEMTGISPDDLRLRVIRPVCIAIGLGGAGVEELLLGTASQESGCGSRIVQNGGPALGVWQMEPATHDDLWTNFLGFRADLAEKVSAFLLPGLPKAVQLIGNLYYACAMARVQYFRSPRPIPSAGDLNGQADIYKLCYNSASGAATIEEYLANAKRVLGG